MKISNHKLKKCILRSIITLGILIVWIPILLLLITVFAMCHAVSGNRMPKYQVTTDGKLYTKRETYGKKIRVTFSHDSVNFGDNYVEFDNYAVVPDICFYYVAPDTIYVEGPPWTKCNVSGGDIAILRLGYWPYTLHPRSSKLYSEYIGDKFLKEKFQFYRDSVLLCGKKYTIIPAYTLL